MKNHDFINLLSTLPHLKSDVEKGIIRKYSFSGILELNSEDKSIIDEIELKGKKFHHKIICVLESVLILGDTEVDVTSYIFTDNEFKPYEWDGCLVVNAKCVNHTWKLNEIGTIGIAEKNGTLTYIF